MSLSAFIFAPLPQTVCSIYKEYAGMLLIMSIALIFLPLLNLTIFSLPPTINDTDTTTPTPDSNFLKGAHWSPDGNYFLTASNDNTFRVFQTPSALTTKTATDPSSSPASLITDDHLHPSTRIPQGGLIYDYCWCPTPLASSEALDTVTSVDNNNNNIITNNNYSFLSTSKNHPIQLWNALNDGTLISTYCPKNEATDQLESALSVAVDPQSDCETIWAGYKDKLRIFNLDRPGYECDVIMVDGGRSRRRSRKRRRCKEGGGGGGLDMPLLPDYENDDGIDGFSGLVSCIDFTPPVCGPTALVAAGSYSGSAALFDPLTGEMAFVLEGHTGGITQVKFGADGNYLYTGARRDGAIRCWDVRFTSDVVYTLERESKGTNQKIGFSIEPCGRHLASGGEDGWIGVWDLRDGSKVGGFEGAKDVVNGVHFHPDGLLLLSASGERRYEVEVDTDDLDDEEGESDGGGGGDGGPEGELNCMKIWKSL